MNTLANKYDFLLIHSLDKVFLQKIKLFTNLKEQEVFPGIFIFYEGKKIDDIRQLPQIRLVEDSIHISSDKLGLTNNYLYQIDSKDFIITNSLNILSKLFNLEIDFEKFASRWLYMNQLSDQSILKNAIRVTLGNSIAIDRNGFKIIKENWSPDFDDNYIPKNIFLEMLMDQIEKRLRNENVLLSLSGGLDSRVILSVLLNITSIKWESFSLGSPNLPDCRIASIISKKFAFKHKIIDKPDLEASAFIKFLTEYLLSLEVTNPASNALIMINYNYLIQPDAIIIDGGFGEIWRRQYLNRLSTLGKHYLIKRDYQEISKFLRHYKPPLFNNEITALLEKSVIEELSAFITSLPDINKIGIENWLDLFSIKSRLPNFFGFEQNRLDKIIPSYMPFADIELIKNIFKVKVSDRKNGKLFNYILKKLNPNLTDIKLVRSNKFIPFTTNNFLSALYSKLFPFYAKEENHYQKRFFSFVKEFSQDILTSSEVITNEHYDKNFINNLRDRIYANDINCIKDLDWFLSFEIYRRSLSQKPI